MNVFVIHGSMRRGNTYQLTQRVIARLREKADVQIEELELRALELPFCVSCHTCFESGEDSCPHAERMRPVRARIENCDLLIMSGAVYSLHLNAAMKNLVDHLSYYFHRPRLFSKKCLVVTTTAGAADGAIARYLKSTAGHWGIGDIETLHCAIRTVPFALTEKQRRRVERKADAIYEAVRTGRRPHPSIGAVAVHNSFRGMCTAKVVTSAYDRAYWQQSGFADRVYPYSVNPLKAAVGGILCALMRRIIDKTVRIDRDAQ